MAPVHAKTEQTQVISRSKKLGHKIRKYRDLTQKSNQANNRSPNFCR